MDSVSVNLPFGTINIKPHSRESETAKEIVIFLSDRRVLDAAECCDECVDAALKSIQEIRAFLVEKQLGLKDHTDSVLYMLVEIMLTELRQFQTQVQILERPQRGGARILETEPNYYLALNCLRGELLALLSQIANIAASQSARTACSPGIQT